MQIAPPETERPAENPAEELAAQPIPSVLRRRLLIAAAVLLGTVAGVVIILSVIYVRMAPAIDERLKAGPFADSVNILTAPYRISSGDSITSDELVRLVRRGGIAVRAAQGSVEFDGKLVQFSGGKIAHILSMPERREVPEVVLKSELMTNLSGDRERRRLVRFQDLPASLIHAVVSVEDKKFFRHSGFDVPRTLKAVYVDLRSGRKQQGASTLSMQLARGLWLEPKKRWTRKLQEMLITMHLEQSLTKQQIFEYYSNQVYLGRRDTFSIHGFAEGAREYFGKDLPQLTNAEVALLAGLVQRPSYYNPYRYPERARVRRDLVLRLMRDNGYLKEPEYASAIAAPLKLAGEHTGGDQSHYFVDLAREEIRTRLKGDEDEGRQVFTSLDPLLQDAAEAAVRMGMERVDRQLRGSKGQAVPAGQPQVALIALDPRTGEVKALVGGRDYGTSQLNHAVSMRQPGSVFKPFVYAAAIGTGVEGADEVFTPASMLSDEPRTFMSGGQVYQPGNFGHEFLGDVTMRTALAHSLNVATVGLATKVGLNRVVETARRAGLNEGIKATPSVALGAYEATPLEIAGAYTAFANQGMRVTPSLVSEVRGADGRVLYRHAANPQPALDPRVAFLMVSMLQDVLRRGTGASVWSFGLRQVAAGKTGTSRDGWFAGFTSELLCVVWVGFDDNRDLKLEGARSALPIWAEFMTRAARYRPYRESTGFRAPNGIESAEICEESGELANPQCPKASSEVFIAGTAPTEQCSMHRGTER